jgi:hypothetical protein
MKRTAAVAVVLAVLALTSCGDSPEQEVIDFVREQEAEIGGGMLEVVGGDVPTSPTDEVILLTIQDYCEAIGSITGHTAKINAWRATNPPQWPGVNDVAFMTRADEVCESQA